MTFEVNKTVGRLDVFKNKVENLCLERSRICIHNKASVIKKLYEEA